MNKNEDHARYGRGCDQACATPPSARVEEVDTPGRNAGAQAATISRASWRKSRECRRRRPGGDLQADVIAALEGDFRSRNPGQYLRSRPDLRGRVIRTAAIAVTMTLTTPHCPVAELMPGEVELRVRRCRACAMPKWCWCGIRRGSLPR